MSNFSEFLLNNLKVNLEAEDLILFSQSKHGSQFAAIKEEDVNSLPIDTQFDYARQWAENLQNPSKTSLVKWDNDSIKKVKKETIKMRTPEAKSYDESWLDLAKRYKESEKNIKIEPDKETIIKTKDAEKIIKKKRVKVKVKRQKGEDFRKLNGESLVTCPDMPNSASAINHGSTEEHYDELFEVKNSKISPKKHLKHKKSMRRTKNCDSGLIRAFKALFRRKTKRVESHRRLKSKKVKSKMNKKASKIPVKQSPNKSISSSDKTKSLNLESEKNYDNNKPIKASDDLSTKQNDLIKNLFSYLNNYDGDGVTIRVTANNRPSSQEIPTKTNAVNKNTDSTRSCVPFYLKCCLEVKPQVVSTLSSTSSSMKIKMEDKATQSYATLPIKISLDEPLKTRLSCKSLNIQPPKSEKSSYQSFKTAKVDVSDAKEPPKTTIKKAEDLKIDQHDDDQKRRQHRRKKEKPKQEGSQKSEEKNKEIEMFYLTTSENQPFRTLWSTVKKICSKSEQQQSKQDTHNDEPTNHNFTLRQKSCSSLLDGPHRYSHQNVFKTLLKSKSSKVEDEVTPTVTNHAEIVERKPKKRLEQLISELSTEKAIQELRSRYDELQIDQKPKTLKSNNIDKIEFVNHMKELANVLANKYGTLKTSTSILETSQTSTAAVAAANARKQHLLTKRRKSTRIGWRPAIGKQPRSTKQLLKEISALAAKQQKEHEDKSEHLK